MTIDRPRSVAYATASAAAVEDLVAAQFGLEGPLACRLLNRGFNDCFAVRTGAGERFVLRLSGQRARGPADVAGETAFLAALDRAGVLVAAAVPRRDGALCASADLPDGTRAAVLFRWAEGRRPDLDSAADARAEGRTLARLHDAADAWPDRAAGRQRLDVDHLLRRPLAAIAALDIDAAATQRDLAAFAERLAEAVGRRDPGLSRTRLHGDCHGLNARILESGPRAGEALFFDFDDGGFGYLAYDLAVHLWAQVSFGRRRQAVWRAFVEGYAAIRPITPADEAAIDLFVPIRHIWLMGEYAGRTAQWGSEILSSAWLARELGFLQAWELDRLSPRLL